MRACGLLLRPGPSGGGRAAGRPSPLPSGPCALCRPSWEAEGGPNAGRECPGPALAEDEGPVLLGGVWYE